MPDSMWPATTRSGVLLLVPGFFAFERFANIPYFAGLDTLLPTLFARHGVRVELDVVSLPPTASLSVRAWALLQRLSALQGDNREIYLVGHSSGGLDIRVALSPTSPLALAHRPGMQDVLKRVKSVTTVSTPHYGTPLASLASGLGAQRVLKVLSQIFVLIFRYGQLPMGAMFHIGRALAKVDEYVGLKGEVLDQLYRELLVMAPQDYFDELERHFRRVGAGQGLIGDLLPELCAQRNRECSDRPTVRYGSVISMAPRPGWRNRPRIGRDPYAYASYALFCVLHTLAGKSARGTLPLVTNVDERKLKMNLGRRPTPKDSDGIVPSCSQLWGELVDAVQADHLDTMGYFSGRAINPTHVNGLVSGSGFSALRFEQMWRRVTAFLLNEPVLPLGPGPRFSPVTHAKISGCLPPSSSP